MRAFNAFAKMAPRRRVNFTLEELRANHVPSWLSTGPLSVGTGGLVGAVVGALAVLVALGLVLAFLVVRHRRLQRSFVSFANTHYDTRSGATTFSTGADNGGLADDEDDDDPIIRGFSDDEPLVVA